MILLLDTSTSTVKLVIYNTDGKEESRTEWEADRAMARGLLGYIDRCMGIHHLSIHDISSLGVFRGPGSFTGLRIGLTVVNTLADSLSVPVVGAAGDDWEETALKRLRQGDNDVIILPEYGGEANITRPRK